MEDFYSKYLTSLIKQKKSVFAKSFVPMGNSIYCGKILNHEFCDYTVNLVKSYPSKKGKVENLTNSMHYNAISTKELGIANFIDNFSKNILETIVNSLFPNKVKIRFDSTHSYIVRYGPEYDRELGLHVDDSLITMNLCLNDGFSGSDLILNGTRCPIHMNTHCSDNKETCIKHEKGVMILHAGKNRHYVTPIEEGERYNLIVWCQNNDEKNQWLEALDDGHCLDYCDFYL